MIIAVVRIIIGNLVNSIVSRKTCIVSFDNNIVVKNTAIGIIRKIYSSNLADNRFSVVDAGNQASREIRVRSICVLVAANIMIQSASNGINIIPL